jgi:hypothetical protein
MKSIKLSLLWLTHFTSKRIISGSGVIRPQSTPNAKGDSDFPQGISGEANFAGRFPGL